MSITRSFVGVVMDTAAGRTLTYPAAGSFDSTGFTHIAIGFKHEGATVAATPSDNKGTTWEAGFTKQGNGVADSWAQWFVGKIGTPGTGHTATLSLGTTSPDDDRPFRTLGVYLINSGTGEIALAHATPANAQATATGTTAGIDAGTITTDAAAVTLMMVAEYTAVVYSNGGAGWTEDFDPNGPNYTYFQSRSDASGATIDPVATGNTAQDWAAAAIAFKEAPEGGVTLDTQPENASAPVGDTATYSVTGTGITGAQAQVSTDGGETWTNVSGASSTSTTAEYTTPAATADDNGKQYRLQVTDGTTTLSSAGAWLFVSGLSVSGKGRKFTALYERLERRFGRTGNSEPQRLRSGFYGPAGGPANAHVAAALADWFFIAEPPAPPPPPPVEALQQVGTARARPGRGPYSVGRYYRPDMRVYGAPLITVTIALGQASETDTSLALTARLVQAVGQVSETDTAQPVTARVSSTLGQPSETDSAFALTARTVQALGQPSETDSGLAVTARVAATLGQASETDSALALTARQVVQLGQPSETDSAQPVTLGGGTGVAVGQALETDTAPPITARVVATLGQAAETDSAQPVTARVQQALGIPSETDTAQPLGATLRAPVGQASETDSALAVGANGATPVGQATEADSAQPLAAQVLRTLGQPAETDTAQTVTAQQGTFLGQTVETDTAQPVSVRLSQAVGQASESDSALAMGTGAAIAIGQASETDTALAVLRRFLNTIQQAAEEDSALRLVNAGGFIAGNRHVERIKGRERVERVKARGQVWQVTLRGIMSLVKRSWEQRRYDFDCSQLLASGVTLQSVSAMVAEPAAADAPITFGDPSINLSPAVYGYGTAPAGTVVQCLIGGGADGGDYVLRARCLDSNGEKVEGTVLLKVRDEP